MYTPTQLEAIKLFGRKDLTEGCILTATVNENKSEYIVSAYWKFNHTNIAVIKRDFISSFSHWADVETGMIRFDNWDIPFEILWHIPHLEDLCIKIQKRVDADIHDIAWYRIDWESLDIFSWRSPTWEKKDLNAANNTWTKIYSIPYNPTITLLDQPSLPDIISLFK